MHIMFMEENKITNSFMIASGMKKLILDAFGAAVTNPEFHWDLDSFVEYIKNDEGVKSEFDVYKLKNDEMLNLGFGYIKDIDYLLIPAWIYQFLPDELGVVPEGETEYKVMNKSDMDLTLVNGCLRYGIYPSDIERRSELITK